MQAESSPHLGQAMLVVRDVGIDLTQHGRVIITNHHPIPPSELQEVEKTSWMSFIKIFYEASRGIAGMCWATDTRFRGSSCEVALGRLVALAPSGGEPRHQADMQQYETCLPLTSIRTTVTNLWPHIRLPNQLYYDGNFKFHPNSIATKLYIYTVNSRYICIYIYIWPVWQVCNRIIWYNVYIYIYHVYIYIYVCCSFPLHGRKSSRTRTSTSNQQV